VRAFPVECEVLTLERERLGHPEPGAGEQLDQRPVAGRGEREHGRELVAREGHHIL